LVSCRLVFLTLGAASDEVNKTFIHFWPPEVASDEFDYFILAHVPCDFRVVFLLENQFFEVSILRDPEHTPSVE